MTVRGRVLVTGAGGQVGGRLVELLAGLGLPVRAFARRRPRAALPGVETALGDLLDPESLSAAVRDCEVVVHCAAHLGGPDAEADVHAVNVAGTRGLLDCARQAGVRRFVLTSSVAVYGEGDLLDVTEARPPAPTSAYGRSKAAAERVVAESAGLEWAILRPCGIYGPAERRFLPGFAHMLRSGGLPLVGAGATVLDLVHVDDVCRALLLAATRAAAAGGVFNVAEGVRRTVLDMMRLMAQALGVPLRTVPAETVPGLEESFLRTLGEHRHFSIERARAVLGYAPAVPLERGLPAALCG